MISGGGRVFTTQWEKPFLKEIEKKKIILIVILSILSLYKSDI